VDDNIIQKLVTTVETTLRDADEDVRAAAVCALAKLRNIVHPSTRTFENTPGLPNSYSGVIAPEIINAIVRHLADPHSRVQTATLDVLKQLAGKGPSDDGICLLIYQ
jgi:HEAT repeat protein